MIQVYHEYQSIWQDLLADKANSMAFVGTDLLNGPVGSGNSLCL